MESKSEESTLLTIIINPQAHVPRNVEEGCRDVATGRGVNDANNSILLHSVHKPVALGILLENDWVPQVLFDGLETVASVIRSSLHTSEGFVLERLTGEDIGIAGGLIVVFPLVTEIVLPVARIQDITFICEEIKDATAVPVEIWARI